MRRTRMLHRVDDCLQAETTKEYSVIIFQLFLSTIDSAPSF